MHAAEINLLDFLKKSTQFTIPIFQRTYSWGPEEIQQLWEDIIRTGKNENIRSHFIGSIVYIMQENADFVFQSAMVIDGQQRLTTISLILEAIARRVGDKEPVAGFSANKIRQYYLLNHLEEGEREYKLLLTQTDKDTLIYLIKQRNYPIDYSYRIKEAYDYFEKKIASLGNNLLVLCNGLAKLMVVSIALANGQDNPQLIFESMNSTGKVLSQADLIRNYVLMDLNPPLQTRLYEEYWRPMEVSFGQAAYEIHFDAFMRHYLTIRTGEIPRVRDVYKAFKEFSVNPEKSFHNIDSLLQDMFTFSTYYVAMALGKEKNKKLSKVFQDLRDLNVDVAYPFLLELYDDYRNGILSIEDFLNILRLTESYVFRRAICNIPTNSLNKTFSNFTKSLKKENYLESIKATYQLMPSYRRFPTREEFEREIQIRDLYNFRNRTYWLRKIENSDRKEPVSIGEYSIEHIMPQNENLSNTWQNELGKDWKQIHDTWLHTLGNLTLTGYNSEYSDRSFSEKKNMVGGFKQSPLKLNERLVEVKVWNEEAIKNRASRLAKLALKVWEAPDLPEEILKQYKEKEKTVGVYSIEDHPHLSSESAMLSVFDTFRKEIFSIDPAISEEFLKHYVAYKAETNFVDIVPLANSLRIYLNMPFQNIHDPRKICRDVSHIGTWGNGEIELRLISEEEIPYVMSLVRQSFEYQMGNGREDA